jgi:hypothetical protein
MPDAPRNSMRNAARVVAVALIVLCGAACSIRQDAAGVTRTGIGLWGFGDPPGVNWNLDRPRREVPDLPASRHPELPPRAVEPVWQSSDVRNAELHAGGLVHPWRCVPSLREGAILHWGGPERSCDRRGSAIGDNRARVPAFPTAAPGPVAVRALPRPLVPDHG